MRFPLWIIPSLLAAQTYDVVLQRGRVLDPESGLDAVRSVGIKGKKIVAISTRPLRGKIEIDAAGLVVSTWPRSGSARFSFTCAMLEARCLASLSRCRR
jgi:hypothetical protein